MQPPAATTLAGVAKRKPQLHFESASFSKQHPAKESSRITNADAVVEADLLIGICDGVSGVHALGLPPEALPREMLHSAKQQHDEALRRDEAARAATSAAFCMGGGLLSQRHREDADHEAWIKTLIREAYGGTSAQGATTLLLGALREGADGAEHLVTANLGDCGLLLLRPKLGVPGAPATTLQPVFRSEASRYHPQVPVQVQRLRGVTTEQMHQVIYGAKVQVVPVQPGDVVVVGSDGLFDNLRDEDIAIIVQRHCEEFAANWREQVACSVESSAGSLGYGGSQQPPQSPGRHGRRHIHQYLHRLARELVYAAISRASDPGRSLQGVTSEATAAAAGHPAPGGNADDTTALVAVVTCDEEWVRSRRQSADVARCGHSRSVLRDLTNTSMMSNEADKKDTLSQTTMRLQQRLLEQVQREEERMSGSEASGRLRIQGPRAPDFLLDAERVGCPVS